MRSQLWILGAMGLAACSMQTAREEAALKAEFTPVTTRAAFVEQVAGKSWQSDEIRVSFTPDGQVRGEVNGVPVTGTWRWSGELFCTGFHVGDSGGDGCAQVGIRPGTLLAVPLSGKGAPYTYTEISG